MAKYQCPECGYTYDEVVGHPHEGFPAGTLWSQVPESWACPDCSVRDKVDFVRLEESSDALQELSVASKSAAAQTSQRGEFRQ
ncbi:MAG: Rubredoxin-1 [Chloroflexi bacterium]|nr:Rubredoxin-1 [Chloroflexota bacterium]